jgi:2-keto-4-pentenoate hydratase/2-oxohepta-3-ene-1,7-dioic acid hydratase in catechol pathway
VKPEAFDAEVRTQQPLPAGRLSFDTQSNEYELTPDLSWMGDVDPSRALAFVGYRATSGTIQFCVVVACSPTSDRLVLFPLESGESPVQVIADSRRRNELRRMVDNYASRNDPSAGARDLISISLQRAVGDNLLGPPLPAPRHIFAVAVNYPSHLRYDLAIDDIERRRRHLAASRPRVFLKFPQLLSSGDFQSDASCIRGAFDGIRYNRFIEVPDLKTTSALRRVQTRLDYEVEIGAVVGRHLTWETVLAMDDAELQSAICAYVLVSDTKARNPQVVRKMISNEKKPPPEARPYRIADSRLNDALGAWDSETCRWWSYAASQGTCASLGPFLVAAPADGSLPSRAMVGARTYASKKDRQFPPPKKRVANVFYLRQCSRATDEPQHPDCMIWGVPQIIRSILAPDNVLPNGGNAPSLEPGDVICLGTPGGVVITSSSETVVDLLDFILFWLDPIDWHNLLFRRNAGLYLHQGDQLFLWAEGLGFQRQTIQRQDSGE